MERLIVSSRMEIFLGKLGFFTIYMGKPVGSKFEQMVGKNTERDLPCSCKANGKNIFCSDLPVANFELFRLGEPKYSYLYISTIIFGIFGK